MPLYELIPAGSPGTEQALRRMTELADKDSRNWEFIKQMSRLVHRCPHKDQVAELKCIFDFWKNTIRYQPDPLSALQGYVELIQAPMRTIERGAADCDDYSCGIAASALALGMRPRFVVLKANPELPDEWSHVYAIVQANGKWYGMDPTVAGSYVGWQPKKYLARGEWRI